MGWFCFLLTAAALLGLFLWLGCRALRQRGNPCGRLITLSVSLSLLLQTVGAITQNLGYCFFTSVSIPIFSGNLNMVLTMALLGLALSTLRQTALPEEEAQRPVISAPVVQTN